MLFEEFLNRHIRPELNRLSFPSRIFPFFIILGILMQVVLPVFPILGREVLPNWPGLFRAVGLTGLGLIGGSIAVGCMWGLLKERIRDGYLRPNFGSAFAFYSVVLMVSWFIVWFFLAGFLSEYPFKGYRSYILEVKPTPGLKAEIERLGLYEIKRHSPYDYALDRQTIRYDFLNQKNFQTFESRQDMFIQTARHYKKRESNWSFSGVLDLSRPVSYPEMYVLNGGEVRCGVVMSAREEKLTAFNSRHEEEAILHKILDDPDGGVYDVTGVFYPHSSLGVCKLAHDADEIMAELIVAHVLLPEVRSNVYRVVRSGHKHLDFSFKRFMAIIKSY